MCTRTILAILIPGHDFLHSHHLGAAARSCQTADEPYDPEILFNQEAELSPFGLDPKIENHWLTVSHPTYGHRKAVGKKVILIPELVNGKPVYLGKYKDMADGESLSEDGQREAILITETVQVGQRTLLKAGSFSRRPLSFSM